MAFVDSQRHRILLLPHKTGTTSIRNIVANQNRASEIKTARKSNHPNLEQLSRSNPDIAVDEYVVYSFYRDPVDKFLSFMAFNYANHPEMSPVNSIQEFVEKYGTFAHQVRWLKHDSININLLDYRNFESELRKVFPRFGIPSDTSIPLLNSTGETRLQVSDLTQSEIDFIKEIYADDYEFFASKGITFQ